MATGSDIGDFLENLANAMLLDTDTVMMALSNTAPASESSNPTADSNGVLANVTQVAYTNYADTLTTDRTLESVSSSATSGTYTLDVGDFTYSASGGALATHRYIYFYDDTPTTPADPLIRVWDQGSAISLADGDSASVTVNASGVLTIA